MADTYQIRVDALHMAGQVRLQGFLAQGPCLQLLHQVVPLVQLPGLGPWLAAAGRHRLCIICAAEWVYHAGEGTQILSPLHFMPPALLWSRQVQLQRSSIWGTWRADDRY